ncbi:MAG: FAD-dependent oxidoreductase [Clostridia bacterium]|nr:FAD-dependent oxidoreductase [Clostridia bacterium]
MSQIIIIGGGVTGLSTGIHLLLCENNRDTVTICEAHRVPGGNLTGWDRDGYHIDNCVHWLTGTLPGTDDYRLWQDLGVLGDEDTVRLPSLYTVRDGQTSLSLRRDLDRTWREMLALSFEDKHEIDRLFHAVRVLSAYTHTGLERVDLSEMIRYSPVLARYWMISTGTLARRFRHPLIRRFITAVCGEVFSAICLVCIMATFCSGNGDLPAGGSSAMAERMKDRFLSLGGQLMCGQRVKEVILTPDERKGAGRRAIGIVTEKGVRLPADQIVYTGDPAAFCGSVIDAPLPHGLESRYRDITRIRFSGIHAAFAVPKDAVTFSGDLILPLTGASGLLPGCDQVILREFTHEPDFAPEGMTVIQATVFCSEKTAERVIRLSHDRETYQTYKQRTADVFAGAILSECPAAAGRIRLLDVWTPASYRRFTGSEIGSFMSFVLRPGDLPRSLDGRIPGVDNVLLAGQWLHAPGGLPTAAAEGRRAAGIITERERMPEEERMHTRRLSLGFSPALTGREDP